jgi:hypothetical protein
LKTDRLVALLSTGVEPIDSRRLARGRAMVLAGGMAGSLVLCLVLLGINPRLSAETVEGSFWLKEAYCTALAVLGFMAVSRLSRPGRSSRGVTAVIVGILTAMGVCGLIEVLSVQPVERAHLVLGSTAAVCPMLIALLSVPVWLSYMRVMRSLAPTRLRLAGAGGGFAAGATAALVYSLHCPELAAPFVGLWYLLGMAIPMGVGAALGPRLLRW